MTFRLKDILGDRRGAVIIELAFVTPILATMVVGVVDMSNAFSRKLALEQGAQRALEKILQTTDDASVEATLAAEAVCQVNGMTSAGACKTSPITTSDVNVTYSLECTSATGAVTTQSASTRTDTAAADTYNAFTCPSTTVAKAGYISITVNDKYTPIFPWRFAAFNGDGTYHISATAGMRQQ